MQIFSSTLKLGLKKNPNSSPEIKLLVLLLFLYRPKLLKQDLEKKIFFSKKQIIEEWLQNLISLKNDIYEEWRTWCLGLDALIKHVLIRNSQIKYLIEDTSFLIFSPFIIGKKQKIWSIILFYVHFHLYSFADNKFVRKWAAVLPLQLLTYWNINEIFLLIM